jgi:ribosomal protein S18 acetylase RimI-like enzyme
MTSLAVRPCAPHLDDPAVMEEVAAGVHDAGNPYFDHLFGGAAEARRVLREWIRRPDSEVYAGRARLIFDGDLLVGGFIGLDGAACRRARAADMVALHGCAKGAARAALVGRLRDAAGLFARIDDADWYVSKVWVTAALRGKGYGRAVARAAFYPDPPPAGRTIADMAEDNVAALRTYERIGVRVTDRNGSASGLRYVVIRAFGEPR